VNNQSDLVLTSQSFPDQARKKVTGGLISWLMPGLCVHTNTIEEFESINLDAILEQEKSKISTEVKVVQGRKVSQANRFVVCIFGDLKNYVYHYKFATLTHDTSHVNQAKANKVPAVLGDTTDLVAKLTELLLKPDEDQVELQCFTLNDVLCVLDASPKLPSATVINHACLSQTSKILLIREKLSRLSGSVSLD